MDGGSASIGLDRRPDRGLCRPVHVPQLAAPISQRPDEFRGQRFSPAQDPQLRVPLPARCEQHPKCGRCGLNDVRLNSSDAFAQGVRIRDHWRLDQFDATARDERQPDLESGDIERERGDRQQRFPRREAGSLLHRLQEIDERPMRYVDALGPAGRARRVDRVDDVVGTRRIRPWNVSGRGPIRGRDDRIDCKRFDLKGGDAIVERTFGDHELHVCIVEHVPQSGCRKLEIQWQVCGARLEDAEQACHEADLAGGGDADEVASGDTAGDQGRCDPVGKLIQLAVGELGFRIANGWSLGRPGDLPGKQMGQTCIAIERWASLIPFVELRGFGGRDQR